ncbi:hypothetical protein AGR7C_Lc140114 [Agrobacterium deltaense Zutra 3/1]|uniref:Uncharacterized protein n=1 Tax=Agrobacterium deltaense Zutra 3/1 TaxID=1183427 RepID=A0A1S7RAY9_9HYPH|nr:hypothetical protein AGR7C_Lc140114 [Agrobacterium deltaense Zutra 3/1]
MDLKRDQEHFLAIGMDVGMRTLRELGRRFHAAQATAAAKVFPNLPVEASILAFAFQPNIGRPKLLFPGVERV